MAKKLRVRFDCTDEDYAYLTGMLCEAGVTFTVTHLVDPTPPRPAAPALVPRKRGTYIRVISNALARDTKPGQVLLGVFTHMGVARRDDFAEALKDAGFAYSGVIALAERMVREGSLVRHPTQGAYRLPNAMERMGQEASSPGLRETSR